MQIIQIICTLLMKKWEASEAVSGSFSCGTKWGAVFPRRAVYFILYLPIYLFSLPCRHNVAEILIDNCNFLRTDDNYCNGQ